MSDFEDIIITISGLPGSGTSTTAKSLGEKTGMKIISSGEIFRRLAREKGYTLEEFGDVAEQNKQIDIELDKRIVEEAKPGSIIEGRLSGHMLSRSQKDAFKVWITADIDTRIKRIAEREDMGIKRTRKLVKKREESERKRYRDYYDIDILDKEIYDIVIDSTDNLPDEVVSKIIDGVRNGSHN
ncbi:MAG: cytidylate kinase family protein [Candidatus Saliniplasma sp.]